VCFGFFTSFKELDLELRRIDRYTYDVFMGNQWVDHTRVRQTRSGVRVISGNRLPYAVLKELNRVLHPSMPITYGQTVEQMLEVFPHVVAANQRMHLH
jgi:hypothetical protein